MNQKPLAQQLQFGERYAVPDTVTAVWGARWIWPNDQLNDRLSAAGPEHELAPLLDWLDTPPTPGGRPRLTIAQDRAQDWATTGKITQDSSTPVVLYEDLLGVIVANPRASYGYLYVSAYLHQPHPTRREPVTPPQPTSPAELIDTERAALHAAQTIATATIWLTRLAAADQEATAEWMQLAEDTAAIVPRIEQLAGLDRKTVLTGGQQ